MDGRFSKIVFEDNLQGMGEDRLKGFLTHALCLDGSMEFDFNGSHFNFSSPACFCRYVQQHLGMNPTDYR